ncbi:MAG: Ig-like domain-containing protein, partial [Oscillospiraceae bacterium]|nr:Ig-like domain-containing protein [Oscillospiraceae bacterium]
MKKCISLFLALVLLLSLMPAVLAVEPGLDNFKKTKDYPSGLFTDVKDDAWYHDSVKSAYEYGLVKGVSDTAFNPDGNMTLAEALALADRLHSIFYNGTADFRQGEPWYQVYVDYAKTNGIIPGSGYPDYNAKATRAQFAQIFAKALPESALEKINNIEPWMIPDVSITASYSTAVYILYNAGILTGSDARGTFNPDSNIKRSEVSAIVTRMADTSLRKNFTPADRLDPTGISLNKSNVQMQVDGILWIAATVTPANASETWATWESSDNSIATVSGGKVTGIKPGTVTITATTSNGISASCKVTVMEKNPATGITLNKSNEQLIVGDFLWITATVLPDTAENKTVTWTSSDSSVATVYNGKVTGLKPGTVTITASTHNGKTAACKVTVNKAIEITSITLNKTNATITVG